MYTCVLSFPLCAGVPRSPFSDVIATSVEDWYIFYACECVIWLRYYGGMQKRRTCLKENQLSLEQLLWIDFKKIRKIWIIFPVHFEALIWACACAWLRTRDLQLVSRSRYHYGGSCSTRVSRSSQYKWRGLIGPNRTVREPFKRDIWEGQLKE